MQRHAIYFLVLRFLPKILSGTFGAAYAPLVYIIRQHRHPRQCIGDWVDFFFGGFQNGPLEGTLRSAPNFYVFVSLIFCVLCQFQGIISIKL